MRRALMLGLLLPAAATIVASCRDVVSPEPIALVPSLCDLLAQCEGSGEWACPNAVAEPFDALDEEARTDAFARFLASDCLADCRSARKCRDLRPLCTSPSGGCGDDSACCGYTEGVAECRGVEGGRCCAPNGAPCEGAGDCCDGGCNAGHCGDFACTLVDETCSSHFDCCTKRCNFDVEPAVCAPKTCSIAGLPCAVADDCCDEAASCSPNDLGVLTCQIASCGDGCNPFDANNCCVVGGLGFCLLLANAETTCGDPQCPPEGVECGGDDDCRCLTADAADLVCDDSGFPHCAVCRGVGAICDPTGQPTGCCEGTSCDGATSTCLP
jgi:hypothetical protein